MAKVYLETSFFSACVSKRPDAKIQGWRASSNEWLTREVAKHDVFVSAEVWAELSDPTFPQSDEAMKLLQGIPLLAITSEVLEFAEILVQEQIMPKPANAGDAIHVAMAAVHRVDYILSWNVKHLANPQKRTHLAVICMRLGFVAPLIYTPDML